jgi:transketolase
MKVVAAISPELFRLQPDSYRREVLSPGDWADSMCITNRARRLMYDWIAHRVAEEYTLSSDWDDRWRTGGTVDEVLEEAHLSPAYILAGIERFVRERELRLRRICDGVEEAKGR